MEKPIVPSVSEMREKGKKQQAQVLNHMIQHGSITSNDAIYGYRITRLSDVIFKLKKQGFPIRTDYETVKAHDGYPTRIARYSLED